MDISFYTMTSENDALGISVMAVSSGRTPRAVLQLSHGMCGSKERYLPLMKYLAERGAICVANDHRGHGGSVRSYDDLGYMYDGGHKALVADMHQLSRIIRAEYGHLPLYLLGHSMGSLAVRSYLRDDDSDIDGVILCGSPGYAALAPVGYALASVACRMGLGHWRPDLAHKLAEDAYNRNFADEGPLAWTCSDVAVRRAFVEDPLHNFKFTMNGSRSLLGLLMQAYARDWKTQHPELPILFLSGGDDPCTRGAAGLEKAARLMSAAGYRNVGIKIYPAMRHEILNEIGKERVWQDISDFMGL